MAQGAHCYLYGGASKDLICGKTPYDYDLLCTLSDSQLKRLYPDSMQLAHCNHTYRLVSNGESYDVTLYHPSFNLEAMLNNLDFTVNILCIDSKGRVSDPLNVGLSHLNSRTLAIIGGFHRYDEDPTRILRAIYLLVYDELMLSPDEHEKIKQCVPLLEKCAMGRIIPLLSKLFSRGRSARAFEILLEFQLDHLFFPENCNALEKT